MNKQFIKAYVNTVSSNTLPVSIVINTSQILFLKSNPQVQDEYAVIMSKEDTKKAFEICFGEKVNVELFKSITAIIKTSEW